MSNGYNVYICAKCGKSRLEAIKERNDGLEDRWEFYSTEQFIDTLYPICSSCQKKFKPILIELEKTHKENIEKELLKFIQKN
jgi:DNA-directed RNA polymerase subunit RPC12/RpoP